MSKSHLVQVQCPSCNENFDARLWQSLNADLDPDEKQRLLSGEFFRIMCPKCTGTYPFVYSMLYHDMKNEVMIMLATTEEDAAGFKEMQSSLGNSELSKIMSSMSENYKHRIVKTPHDLREKAMIFDCGLDDRVIELIKVYIRDSFARTHINIKLIDILFDSAPPNKFVLITEDKVTKDGKLLTLNLDMKLYQEEADNKKNKISERSKGCFYINREWAEELLKDVGIHNENLPFSQVHYGNEYFAFSDGLDENKCFCLCQKQSIENKVKMFMTHYQYDSCLNPRNELLLSYLGLPNYFQNKVKNSGLPFGEEWLSLLQYSREICHICNSQKPDYQHSIYVHDSDFKKQWGHYMKARYFHYGIDDMEHWGVYFVEDSLIPEHKKLLCPTKDELALELGGHSDDLDRLYALPKGLFDVLVYYRTKAKVLRDNKVVTYYQLPLYNEFNKDFMDAVHGIIHKRFLTVRKSIRDELKRMIPKTATTKTATTKAPTTKKKKK